MTVRVTGTVESTADCGVTVALAPRIACTACRSVSGCGLGSLLSLFARRNSHQLRVTLDAPLTISVGDPVGFSIDSHRLIGLALLAYGLPMFGLLVGAVIATAVTPGGGDLPAAIGAIGGAAAGWIILKLCRFDHRLHELLQGELRRFE